MCDYRKYSDFINALTDEEIEYLVAVASGEIDPDPTSEAIITMVGALVGWEDIYDFPSFPPAPRLVGIETNPGPDETRIIVAPKKPQRKNKNKQSKRTEVQTIIASRIGRTPRVNNAPNRARAATSISGASNFLTQYVNSIEDPWEHGPMKLGYGTMVETGLATGYVRGSLAVNADGSFALIYQPQLSGLVYTNNAGAAVATYSGVPAANAGSFTNQFLTARVCSGGLRAFALFPETSASGVLFAGSVAGYTGSQLTAMTPTGVSNLATSELGIGKRGCRAVLLPVDMSAFNMQTQPLGAYTGTTAYSAPYIAGLGFPAGTVIWYEAVINLEGVPLVSTSSVGIDQDAIPRASDHFLTPESLMRSAMGRLNQTVVMDAVEGLASMIAPNVGRGIRVARSVFGSGRNFNNTLIAGRNALQSGLQSSVIIEEMKEDAGQPPRRSWY